MTTTELSVTLVEGNDLTHLAASQDDTALLSNRATVFSLCGSPARGGHTEGLNIRTSGCPPCLDAAVERGHVAIDLGGTFISITRLAEGTT
jgi:hypothetical protein